MVGSQKILTVSYGTFSCTLEGFEDSFGTMKAIAEYFRDLAADDRYFGAEPPVPDAEMLQRIAQREASRRVDARMEQAGVVLRVDNTAAGSLGRDVEPAAPAAAPLPEPARAAPAVVAPTAVAVPGPPAPAMPPRPALPPEGVAGRGAAPDDGVAAKLARIRAVVGRAAAAASAEEEPARADVLAAPMGTAGTVPGAVDDAAWAAEATPSGGAEPAARRAEGAGVAAAIGAEAVEAEAGPGGDAGVPALLEAPAEAPRPAPDGEATGLAAAGAALVAEERPSGAGPAAAPAGDAAGPVEGRAAGAGAERPAAPTRPRVIRLRRASPAAAPVPSAPPQAEPGLAPSPVLSPTPGPAPAAASEGAPADTALQISPEAEADLLRELAALAARPDALPTRPVDADEGQPEAAVAGLMAALGGPASLGASLGAEGEAGPEAGPGAGAEATERGVEALLAAVPVALPEAPPPDGAPEAAPPAAAGDGPPAEASPEPASEAAPEPEPEPAFVAWATGGPLVPIPGPAAQDAPEPATAITRRSQATPLATAGDVERAPAEASATTAGGHGGLGPLALTAEFARPRPAGGPGGDEAAVSRLLSRADAQLAEPEASRRREALAQLRAAVAATEAARRLGEAAPEPARREDPFRDDLRQAVRPRRPVPQEGRGELRSERPRPAPLKLVASQRVDLPVDARAERAGPVRPVRPRRVTAEGGAAPEAVGAVATGPEAMGRQAAESGEAMLGDEQPTRTSPEAMEPEAMEPEATGAEATGAGGAARGFAAFAAEMGAVSLTDVLEAAAAYTSFVEGAEDFSRPQVIDRAREAGTAGFSREDGLRSFGTLLRQGTITRVRGGRFQVAGESRFNPARRAG